MLGSDSCISSATKYIPGTDAFDHDNSSLNVTFISSIQDKTTQDKKNMPLPIVLGGKSVSAQTLPGPVGRPDESDTGTLLEPLVLYQTLGWGVCPQGEWLVRVTCSYYDLIDPATGARNCTMVEVRIQLSPLTRPLSLDYRETAHHLKLFDGAHDHYPQTQPQVVVSADRKNLAVLLFHPHQQSSALVIFQLRKPRTDLSSAPSTNPIPLPTYIQKVGNEDSNDATIITRDPPAVATHPRFVSVWGISTVCCLPPNVNPSVFLAACQDGSLVWLDARSSMAVATGRLDLTPQQQIDWLPLSSIKAAPSSEMNLGQVLLVTANGKALLVHWNLESTTKVQQTFLKRASTGAVVTESNLPSSHPLRNHSLQPPKKAHAKPVRSKSSDLADMVMSPTKRMQNLFRIQRSVSNTLQATIKNRQNSLTLKPPFADEDTTTKRLDAMVLKELQKKTLSAASTTLGTSSTTTPISPTGPSPLVQKAQQEQINRQQEQQQRRRRSELEGATAVDTLKRQMKLRLLSWVGDDLVVDASFANLPTIVCLLYKPDLRTRRVAQIYTICEGGTFQPLLSLTLSNEQLAEAFKLHTSRSHGSSASANSKTEIEMALQSRQGLDHDPSSDTFAISTIYAEETEHETKNQWVGCLWNWRSNVLSFMIQQPDHNSMWSRLYFAKHPQQANHLAVLECHQDKYLHVRKQVVATGLLSPPSWHPEGECSLEPNSLLLTSDSVLFPEVSQVRKTQGYIYMDIYRRRLFLIFGTYF